jgi:hypothetical protein
VQALDGWERDRTVMPPKRAPAQRPASRGLADIVGGAALGTARDDGIVLDDGALPEDEGSELRPQASPLGALPEAGSAPVVKVAHAVGAPSALTAVAVNPSSGHMAVAATSDPHAAAASALASLGAKPVTKRVSINPFEKKKQVWPLLVVAALGGGAGVYVAVAPDAAPPAPPASPVALAPPTPAVVKPAKKSQTAAEDRDACVVSYFPTGAFTGVPNFEFVCSDRDFREITTSLHQMASPAALGEPGVNGGPTAGGGPAIDAAAPMDTLRPDAGVKGSGLDWYELPATAIIRRHCCPAAAPLSLPESAGWCEQLQSAVRRMADDSSKAVDLSQGARAFDKAVNCLFANKIARPYVYDKQPPTDANRAAFQLFVGRAGVSDARR